MQRYNQHQIFNMKRTLKYYLLVTCLLFTATLISCKKDFLEVTPKGKLIAEKVSDYDLLLNNTSFLTISTGFNGASAQVPMGDEIAAVAPYFSGAGSSFGVDPVRTQRLFRWDAVVYEPDQDAAEMSAPMKNLYSYNKIINEVVNATGGTEEQKNTIRAEAMAGRAWTNWLLINYYGKPYNENTSATDPGFPLVTVADVTETKFERASVKEVYDSIVSDLVAAIPHLPAKTYHRLRMSRAAGEAILGKVYMFMGKFDAALPMLNAAMNDLATATIPVHLYDYNVTMAPGGSMPMGSYGPVFPNAPFNEENIYAKQFINYWTFVNNELVINPGTVALYGPSDLRLNFYSTTAFFSTDIYPNGMLRRMGPISTQLGVTVPDLYLLNAECKTRLDDLTGATTVLEVFRSKRMPPADATVPGTIASDQTALVKFILDERIREFAVQGARWFDMRRLSVDPVYNTTVNYTHALYEETGSITTFTLKPERLVMRFPQKVIDQNPGMENNP
jgi:hypothetical protein